MEKLDIIYISEEGEKMSNFIKGESVILAKKLHKEEHLIVDGKVDKDDKKEAFYYLMASAIFNNLKDELKQEIHDNFTEIYDEVIKLKEEMKEVSKQQKYLWQTLDESSEQGKAEQKQSEIEFLKKNNCHCRFCRKINKRITELEK